MRQAGITHRDIKPANTRLPVAHQGSGILTSMRSFLLALWVFCAPVVLPAVGAATVVSVSACGPSQRTVALRATLVTVNATRDGFLIFDHAQQLDIVKDAPSLEEGKASLLAYRKARLPVIVALETAYRLIATASLSEGFDLLTVARAVEAVSSAFIKLKETL